MPEGIEDLTVPAKPYQCLEIRKALEIRECILAFKD
jgi:hypothetical protein